MKHFRIITVAVLIIGITLPYSVFGAIAFDVATAGGFFATMNNSTFSHTATTTVDRILFCATFGKAPSPTDSVTNVSYNEVQMTKVSSTPTQGPDGRWQTLWYLIAPATGSNTVSSTATSGDGAIQCASYIGVSQTNPIEAFTTNSNSVASTTIKTSLTSVVDNSWMIIGMRSEDGTPEAGAGATLRVTTNGETILDSNAPITPAGSNSMTGASSASTHFAIVMASFAPVVEVTDNIGGIRMGFGF